MLSILGVYTGKEIKPLEDIPFQPNVQVIITFLEPDKLNQEVEPKTPKSTQDLTQLFLDKCGGWKDTRCPADIVSEIYTSRTSSERGKQLFEETL
jgi:hypothetical protein